MNFIFLPPKMALKTKKALPSAEPFDERLSPYA
jgi:hypothetical protein